MVIKLEWNFFLEILNLPSQQLVSFESHFKLPHPKNMNFVTTNPCYKCARHIPTKNQSKIQYNVFSHIWNAVKVQRNRKTDKLQNRQRMQ